MKNYRWMVLTIAIVNCLYATGQTYNEIEKFYNKIAATHEVEKKIEGSNFYRITNLEAVGILGGCYNWGSSGNGSLAIVVGENETNVVLDFAQDLFPNPPYSNITGSVTERAYFSHDGVWSVGIVDDKIIFRCFRCSVHIYLIDYKNTKWVGNHWTSPDKPTQFWFAVTTRNLYGFRMGQMEWEPMTKENVRLGEKQSSKEVLAKIEAKEQAELEKQQAEERIAQEKAIREARTKRGNIGNNLKWELYDGTLTITGRGEMMNLESKDAAPWIQYRDSIKSIIISNEITNIGDYAFLKCRKLTSIAIPNSVTSIGKSAFEECVSLSSITIPDEVTSIDEHTFKGCKKLSSITLPQNLIAIEKGAFADCENLVSITIPDGVTNIGKWAFKDCKKLSSITLPNSVISIGEGAFIDCHVLSSVALPSNITTIKYRTFSDCWKLTSITIPNSVISIGNRAFEGCKLLSSITLSDNLETIEVNAFFECKSLASITIPNSVKYIKGSAFAKTKINTPLYNAQYFLYLPRSYSGTYIIPEGIEFIAKEAFGNCSGLTNIAIPESVKSIGEKAFYGSGLTSVTIPVSVTSIEYYAFAFCKNLQTITIPSSVTSIHRDAFAECSALSITLPKIFKDKLNLSSCKKVKYKNK